MGWFDTIIPAITITASTELTSIPLGRRSLIYITASAPFQLFGLGALGGNQDGMVAVIQSIANVPGITFTYMHESTLTTTPLNRFRNHNGGAIQTCLNVVGGGGGIGGAIYRYFGDAAIQRWIMMSHT